MSVENILFAAICWLCALAFGGIALWAAKRKTPVHFWAGTTVSPENIADIPAYNRANAWMWAAYAACMAAIGAVSLFNIGIGAILLGILCVPGLAVLIAVYTRIYSTYKIAPVTKEKL